MANPQYFGHEAFAYDKFVTIWSRESENNDTLCNPRAQTRSFAEKVSDSRTTPSETDDSSDADSFWSGSAPSTRMSSPALSGIYPFELFMSSLPEQDKREERSDPSTPSDREPSVDTLTWHFGRATLDFKFASALRAASSSSADTKSPHVDYLSHGWVETDLWASWKYVSTRLTGYSTATKQRLENASWRAWEKARSNLQTVPPATLNWLKECDTTWLYGPLMRGRSLVLEDPADDLAITNVKDELARSPTGPPRKKPILKRKDTLSELEDSEVQLSRSQSAGSLLSREALNKSGHVDSDQKARPSRFIATTNRVATDLRRSPPTFFPSSTTGSPRKDHVHFSYEVEQRIALGDTDEESSDREALLDHDTDDDSDSELLMIKHRSRKRAPTPPRKEKNWTRALPSTHLKWHNDGENIYDAGSAVRRLSPCTSTIFLDCSPFDNYAFLGDDEDGLSDDESIELRSHKSLQTFSPVPLSTSKSHNLANTITNLEVASSRWDCEDLSGEENKLTAAAPLTVNEERTSPTVDNVPIISVNKNSMETIQHEGFDPVNSGSDGRIGAQHDVVDSFSDLVIEDKHLTLLDPILHSSNLRDNPAAVSVQVQRDQELLFGDTLSRTTACQEITYSETSQTHFHELSFNTALSNNFDSMSTHKPKLARKASKLSETDDTDGYDTNTESQSGDSILTSSDDSFYERICDVEEIGDHSSRLEMALNPMQQQVVDRVMAEFWTIFNQTWSEGQRNRAGRTSSQPIVDTPSSSVSKTNNRISHNPRKRRKQDDESNEGNSGRGQGTPSSSVNNPSDAGDHVRFACPYRKHDPQLYNVYSHSVCSISHWATISRVKEHLYRAHRIPAHCKRCWEQFKSQAALDAHLTVEASDICSLRSGTAPEGISTEQERRLRSRKKSSPNQSDEERWREIYRILFPDEEVPSPYFEPLPEEVTMSPDSRELAGYEEYIRRELPRLVRSNIEEAVRREMQPLEASLISNLVGIVRDCQDLVFRSYRQSQGLSEEAARSPSPLQEMLPPPAVTGTIPPPSNASYGSSGAAQHNLVANIWRAPSAQSLSSNAADTLHHESPFVPADNRTMDKQSEADSGYASQNFQMCGCYGSCICGNNDQHQMRNYNSTDDVGQHVDWTQWQEYADSSSYDFENGEFSWKLEESSI